METVTVSGKIYQIGAIYWAAGEYLELVRAEEGEFTLAYPDKSASHVATNRIKAVDQELGTITDAPIELEPGKWYEADDYGVLIYWNGCLRYNKKSGLVVNPSYLNSIHEMVKA